MSEVPGRAAMLCPLLAGQRRANKRYPSNLLLTVAVDRRPKYFERKLNRNLHVHHGSGARLIKMVCGPAPAKEIPASTRAASMPLSAAVRTSNWQPGAVINLQREYFDAWIHTVELSFER